MVIGVGGCVASQEGEAITAACALRRPGVRAADPAPPAGDDRRVSARRGRAGGRRELSRRSRSSTACPSRGPKVRAPSCPIMEGCSKYCSFCVVPYTRGEEVSRPFDDVMAESRALAAQGVREVTLLGQNVNAYRGADGGRRSRRPGQLIHYVAASTASSASASPPRIRVEFNDSLIEAYARVPKLASHLHLPVQCGSDRILALMKRGYTALEYREKIRRLREVRPDISVSVRFHRRLSRRDRARFRGDHAADRGHRLRPVVQLRLQPPARHAGGRAGRRRAATRRRARLARCRRGSTAGAGDQPRHGRQRAARAGRAARRARNSASSRARTENNRWVNFDGDRDLIGVSSMS